MNLIICPGLNKLYRLALIGPGPHDFEPLSEHDSADEAVAAKRAAEAASQSAINDLGRIAA